uniref:Uncharacterized protein n=1 Tax=Glossina palpalis gambiensis TaxID=67801 RepID=A0A1B0BIY5_9MUSC
MNKAIRLGNSIVESNDPLGMRTDYQWRSLLICGQENKSLDRNLRVENLTQTARHIKFNESLRKIIEGKRFILTTSFFVGIVAGWGTGGLMALIVCVGGGKISAGCLT